MHPLQHWGHSPPLQILGADPPLISQAGRLRCFHTLGGQALRRRFIDVDARPRKMTSGIGNGDFSGKPAKYSSSIPLTLSLTRETTQRLVPFPVGISGPSRAWSPVSIRRGCPRRGCGRSSWPAIPSPTRPQGMAAGAASRSGASSPTSSGSMGSSFPSGGRLCTLPFWVWALCLSEGHAWGGGWAVELKDPTV